MFFRGDRDFQEVLDLPPKCYIFSQLMDLSPLLSGIYFMQSSWKEAQDLPGHHFVGTPQLPYQVLIKT